MQQFNEALSRKTIHICEVICTWFLLIAVNDKYSIFQTSATAIQEF